MSCVSTFHRNILPPGRGDGVVSGPIGKSPSWGTRNEGWERRRKRSERWKDQKEVLFLERIFLFFQSVNEGFP
jgi:hypothetical protein